MNLPIKEVAKAHSQNLGSSIFCVKHPIRPQGVDCQRPCPGATPKKGRIYEIFVDKSPFKAKFAGIKGFLLKTG
jgi:hypothetical protein